MYTVDAETIIFVKLEENKNVFQRGLGLFVHLYCFLQKRPFKGTAIR
jgi:hypothetical protein